MEVLYSVSVGCREWARGYNVDIVGFFLRGTIQGRKSL